MTNDRIRAWPQRAPLAALIIAAGFGCGAGSAAVESGVQDSGPATVVLEGGVEDSGSEASVQNATAFIRVAQWSPDAPAFDLCLAPHATNVFTGPLLIDAFSSCAAQSAATQCAPTTDAGAAPWPAFPQTSPYVRATPGQYDARPVVAGAIDCSLGIAPDATNLPTIAAGGSNTIALVGSFAQSLQLLAFSDDRAFPSGPFAGAVALRFIHAAPTLPAVDVGIGDIGDFQPLFLGVPFGTVGDIAEATAQEVSDAGDAGPSWPPVVPPISFVDDNGYECLDQPLANVALSIHVPYAAQDVARATNVSIGAGTVVTIVLPNQGAASEATSDAGALNGRIVECIESMADATTAPPCALMSNSSAPSPDSGASEASASVTFTEVYTTILKPTCAAVCHGGAHPFAGLNMGTQAEAFSNLVNVMAAGSACGSTGEVRVVPGNAAKSLLYNKVAGTQDCGVRMPYGGPYLDQALIDLIETWIDEGAPNN